MCMRVCVCVGGGRGVTQDLSQILATIDSSRGETARKTLSAMKSFMGNMRYKLLQDIYREYFVVLELADSNFAQTLLNPSKVI